MSQSYFLNKEFASINLNGDHIKSVSGQLTVNDIPIGGVV